MAVRHPNFSDPALIQFLEEATRQYFESTNGTPPPPSAAGGICQAPTRVQARGFSHSLQPTPQTLPFPSGEGFLRHSAVSQIGSQALPAAFNSPSQTLQTPTTSGTYQHNNTHLSSGNNSQQPAPYNIMFEDTSGQSYVVLPNSGMGFSNSRSSSSRSAPDRSSRSRTRNRLFQPTTLTENQKFIKTVILLEQVDRSLPKAPQVSELRLLSGRGLGAQDVTFFEHDTPPTVDFRIRQKFQILSTIRGGLKLWVAGSGNSLSLNELGTPIVGGFQLKAISGKRIYVSPLREDEIFPLIVALTGVTAECRHCGEAQDLSIISVHESACSVPSTSGVAREAIGPSSATISSRSVVTVDSADLLMTSPTPGVMDESTSNSDGFGIDVTDLLNEHRDSVMFVSDSEARSSDSEFKNSFSVVRSDYLESCIAAACSERFKKNIGFPLVVTFLGEEGIDYGGLRDDLVGMMYDSIESTIEVVDKSYRKSILGEEMEGEIIPIEELRDRLYAFGVWSAIGVVQCNFCSPFILHYSSIFDDEHPFNNGLSILRVPDLLKNKVSHKLFDKEDVTAAKLISFLVQEDISCEPLRRMAEKRAYKHFIKFIYSLENGDVSEKDALGKPLNVGSIFQFITGSRIVPRIQRNYCLKYSFLLNDEGSYLRPMSSTCSTSFKIPLTCSKKEMRDVWISALKDSGSTFTRL